MLMRIVAAAVAVMFLGAATVTPTQFARAEAQKAEKAQKTDKKKEPSEAQKAARERMKECGAEWQEQKKAGKTKGTTWRKFSSECLKKKKGET
jgi:hypothetical protein